MTRLAIRLLAWLWCRDIDRAARLARRARLREERERLALVADVRRYLGLL